MNSASLKPLAVVNGEPWQKMPKDLYIPPEALEVSLQQFEGPLDLLLYLIRKHNLDILDIPVLSITQQYLAYINAMDATRVELAADYLVMAAYLVEIKSRLLLPKPQLPEDFGTVEDDPRAELIARLVEFQLFATAAVRLDELPRWERDLLPVHVTLPPLNWPPRWILPRLIDFEQAYSTVLERNRVLTHHVIVAEPMNTQQRMGQVLQTLRQLRVWLDFAHLLHRHEGKAGVVVTFLAVLELIKLGVVQVDQPTAENLNSPALLVRANEWD